MIGGFERPSAGRIAIDGQDVTRLPPERRPTGMVFQSHALWTHMNVFKNIAFGLKLRRLPKAEIRRKVEAVLELVGLSGYGSRLTHQLSGGQQQRVALARSLVLEPKILLLDEPFASLDQHLRERLREEVRDIQQRLKITTLFVTHAQDEALALADRIVVMRAGRAEQVAPPDIVYREPATPFVAGFIGTMNLIEGHVAGGTFTRAGLSVPLPIPDGPAILAVRPEVLGIVVCARRGGCPHSPGHRLRHPRDRRPRPPRRHPAQVDGAGRQALCARGCRSTSFRGPSRPIATMPSSIAAQPARPKRDAPRSADATRLPARIGLCWLPVPGRGD